MVKKAEKKNNKAEKLDKKLANTHARTVGAAEELAKVSGREVFPGREEIRRHINTTPGMTATSFIPQQVRAAGLDIKDVMTEIIEDTLASVK